MYLMSRIFSSSDVAFISYVSLNFIFGLCTLLMTIMPRLLAIISKAQVSGRQLHRPGHPEDVRVGSCPCRWFSSWKERTTWQCALSLTTGKRHRP